MHYTNPKKFKVIGKSLLIAILTLMLSIPATGVYAKKDKDDKEEKDPVNSGIVSGLKFRSIGPAFASGRISDFAVNPKNHSEFYVSVASGNVWKTTNKGITFKPVFDNYGSYSTGCITMDPNNHNVVWLGTGENNHQRALGYGDGVYKTTDGGKTWKNMGLKESRQIGNIVVDPRNSDVVYVAAEGSVWGPGGDRGLYKTTNGGKTWNKVLHISENTGVNNIVMDPRDPDLLYATSEQRRRHVHTKIGGGPETAIYKSTDGGENWEELKQGLPGGHMGGIGLAISPANPDVVYAIIEATEGKGGFFRSTDRGESWEKRSSHHSSGQYYNEIIPDPKDVDKVYSMETVSKVTKDGGKTWERVSLKGRHVDDHALWIDPKDTEHFIIGGDGGVYITYDSGENYYHVSNLPVIQYYRVNVDNEKPFYNVYGGTQDNNSMGGPNQTLRRDGIPNSEWFVTLGGDGFWQAIDPTNPNIVYSELQYGNVVRYDKKSGESLSIKPVPPEDSLTYKWNWNTPLFLSPHNHKRLYMAANKVFRSNDRGDSWDVISPDLTAQIDRNKWPVMGKYWSVDAVAKDVSTSLYGTIVSLDESPVQEDLLYAGTDDGLIQVTEDAKNWREISEFPGVPQYTYVSDIYASQHDANVVYASFDNRKRDDFKPYLIKSTDKGKSWSMITNGLPENGTVHAIEQDHKNPDLLFAGTEFGIFFSNNGGEKWIQLKSGIPTIAVRDIAIQRDEEDLVLATFGRGFYILDDYSPLRTLDKQLVEKKAHMFDIPTAKMFIQKRGRYGQGSTYYLGENPEYGAVFTYYMKETPKTYEQLRHKREKELFEQGKRIPQLTWKEQREEEQEVSPYLIFTIYDDEGSVVRKITKKPTKGIHRIAWDFRYENPYPVKLKDGEEFNPYKERGSGILAMPGNYKVAVSLYHHGEIKEIMPAKEFKAEQLEIRTIPAEDRGDLLEFQEKLADMTKAIQGADELSADMMKKIHTIKQAILNTPAETNELMKEAERIQDELDEIIFAFHGVTPKASSEEIPPHKMTIMERLSSMAWAHYRSTSGVTETERTNYEILKKDFPPLLEKLKKLRTEDIQNLEDKLEKLNAPWTPGRMPTFE
jgi:photosystem II stability/assembly factor-like uncharacterized protein